jgi:3-deoxy-D-manno-octulosonic-acid transferase
MQLVYNIFIWAYAFGIRLAARFNSKARLWVHGRADIFSTISSAIPKDEKIIWFHCASLGEFEQGRPVLEAFRKQFKEYKIVLTFFSPSGYEVRKNYQQADYVFYLPIDTPQNARKFIALTHPRLAVFVKYEFWFNYLNELSLNKIPLLMISVIFRPSQHFFKPWGWWFRKQLQKVTYFFVQNEVSKTLLTSVKVFHAEVSGDTRFDRVMQLASEEKELPVFEKFADSFPLLIAGSTWPADEDILKALLLQSKQKFKLVLAPHIVGTAHIQQLLEKFSEQKPVLFSAISKTSSIESRVLIIDSIGMLSHIYRYGKIVYIGGGFGAGIHNVLEAATYGLPVIFGPNYQRFQEAVELSQSGGGFPINSSENCLEVFNRLMEDETLLQQSSTIARNYVVENAGATANILEKAKEFL